MKAMILAAGEGTRLRPYTEVLPKPAISMLNVPLGYYSLHHILDLGITDVVVNTYHLPEKIKEVFLAAPFKPMGLHFSDEVGSILGSGGGLAKARTWLEGDSILLMNGDEVIVPKNAGEFQRFRGVFEAKKPLSLLLTMEHSEAGTKFGGVWVDKEDRVWGFGKAAPSVDASVGALRPLHFLGCQILAAKIFDYLPQGIESNILYDGLTQAISEGQVVKAHRINCDWFETGNPQDFLIATGELLKMLSTGHEFLKAFIQKWSPTSQLRLVGSSIVLKSTSAQLSPQTRVSGFAVIGKDAIIESQEVSHLVALPGARVTSASAQGIVLSLRENLVF